jgi:inositol transport system ATP-binding protein
MMKERENSCIVQMRHIYKSFPGVNALKDVSFDVKRGEVHALVGENGAGKSTLMKILAGVYTPDSGEIIVKGSPVEIKKPHDALHLGISMIHQELNPVPEMTVAQNIFLGREPCSKIVPVVKAKKQSSMTKLLLEDLGVDISPDIRMSKLSTAETQMVEIVKAISYNADVIIMDEPSSAITDKEIDRLFAIIRRSKSKNVGVVYISHKMDEVFEISDVVSVLRDGEFIGTLSNLPGEELNHDRVIAMMVGRELKDFFPKEHAEIRDVTFEVKNLTKEGKFKNVTFNARRGEILGVAGLMGAGRTELVEAIMGINPVDSGEIFINGKRCHITKPSDSINRNLAFVPEDRKLKGLNLKSSVNDNISIINLSNFCRLCVIINRKTERKMVDSQIMNLRIKTPSRNTIVNSLSGGNQQKVVLAKSLIGTPEILILDEPTRGIDVGSKAEIHKLMCTLAKAGKTIIMVSSELPEILGMSDRVVVLHEGEVTGYFDRDEFDQETIMAHAMGHKRMGNTSEVKK